jgi:DNA-directed RNA polymerase sigma subunit (sigma70/sigma32)
MTDGWKLDRQRLAKALQDMSEQQRKQLQARSRTGPKSLTLDEIGMLFLMTRDKIREIERRGGKK